MSGNEHANGGVLIDNPDTKLPPCSRPCQKPGCYATALGFMVFRFVDPDLSIVAHIPFEYRCHEHRLVFLEESFRAEDLERLRKNMIRLLGSELPGYRLGKKAQIFAVFILLNERQVVAAIRVAQQNGMLVFEPDPLPVEYVGLEDMPDPTPGVPRS